ncbi:MAG: 4Fe-4S binding protein [Desulfatiglandaceae bacterium]
MKGNLRMGKGQGKGLTGRRRHPDPGGRYPLAPARGRETKGIFPRIWSQRRTPTPVSPISLEGAERDALGNLRKDIRAVEARLHHLQDQIRTVADGTPGVPMTAVVDPKRCVGCGTCQEVCPVGAITVDEIAHVDSSWCKGCGACVAQCPREALTLQV